MTDKNIAELVDLLAKGELSKTELVSALNQIKFAPHDSPVPFSLATAAPAFELPKTVAAPAVTLPKIPEEAKAQLAESPHLHSQQDTSEESVRPEAVTQTRKTTENAGPELSLGLLARSEIFLREKERKQKSLQERLLAQGLGSCTFRPSINGSATTKNKDKNRVSLDGSIRSCETVEDRLIGFERRKRENASLLKAQLEMQEDAEYSQHCTFRPFIRSATGKSKYWQAALAAGVTPKKEPAVLSFDESECTFHPKTNPLPPSMRTAHEYTACSAYTRLSTPCQPFVTPPGSNRNRPGKSQDHAHTPQGKTRGKKAQPSSFSKFLLRQDAYEAYKQHSRASILKEVTVTPVPKIDPRSRVMAERVDYSTRAPHGYSRDDSEAEAEAWFQPRLVAKQFPDSDNSARMRRTVGKPKSSTAVHEALNCTFRPNLEGTKGKYKEVKSRLGVGDELDTLMARIDEMRKEKEKDNDRVRYQRAADEVAECTYKPKTSVPPRYILAKQELESRIESITSKSNPPA